MPIKTCVVASLHVEGLGHDCYNQTVPDALCAFQLSAPAVSASKTACQEQLLARTCLREHPRSGQVAQVVERSPEKAGVGGSTPSLATIKSNHLARPNPNLFHSVPIQNPSRAEGLPHNSPARDWRGGPSWRFLSAMRVLDLAFHSATDKFFPATNGPYSGQELAFSIHFRDVSMCSVSQCLRHHVWIDNQSCKE